MEIVQKPERDIDNVTDAEFYEHFNSSMSMRLGDYPTILDNWLSVFPPESLFIGFFEDVKQCPQKLLTEIFAHLGLSQDVSWDSFPWQEIVRPGVEYKMPERFREFLREKYRPVIEEMYARFGERVAHWRC